MAAPEKAKMNLGKMANTVLGAEAGFTKVIRRPPQLQITKLFQSLINELVTRSHDLQPEGNVVKRTAVQAAYRKLVVPQKFPLRGSPSVTEATQDRPFTKLPSRPLLARHLFHDLVIDTIKDLGFKNFTFSPESSEFIQTVCECIMVFVFEECLVLYKKGEMTPANWIEKIKENFNLWAFFDCTEIPLMAWKIKKRKIPKRKRTEWDDQNAPAKKKPKKEKTEKFKAPRIEGEKTPIANEKELRNIIKTNLRWRQEPIWINGLRSLIFQQFDLKKELYGGKWQKYLKGLPFVKIESLKARWYFVPDEDQIRKKKEYHDAQKKGGKDAFLKPAPFVLTPKE